MSLPTDLYTVKMSSRFDMGSPIKREIVGFLSPREYWKVCPYDEAEAVVIQKSAQRPDTSAIIQVALLHFIPNGMLWVWKEQDYQEWLEDRKIAL